MHCEAGDGGGEKCWAGGRCCRWNAPGNHSPRALLSMSHLRSGCDSDDGDHVVASLKAAGTKAPAVPGLQVGGWGGQANHAPPCRRPRLFGAPALLPWLVCLP